MKPGDNEGVPHQYTFQQTAPPQAQTMYSAPPPQTMYVYPQQGVAPQPQYVYVQPAQQIYGAPMGHVLEAPPANKRNNQAEILAVSCLVLYIVSWFCIITSVASVALSLHMVKKRYVVRMKSEVIAFSILELIAFAFIISFSWYGEEECYYYYYYTSCYYNWWGWISFVVWGAFNLAFGIPRVVFSWRYEKSSLLGPQQQYVPQTQQYVAQQQQYISQPQYVAQPQQYVQVVPSQQGVY